MSAAPSWRSPPPPPLPWRLFDFPALFLPLEPLVEKEPGVPDRMDAPLSPLTPLAPSLGSVAVFGGSGNKESGE